MMKEGINMITRMLWLMAIVMVLAAGTASGAEKTWLIFDVKGKASLVPPGGAPGRYLQREKPYGAGCQGSR